MRVYLCGDTAHGLNTRNTQALQGSRHEPQGDVGGNSVRSVGRILYGIKDSQKNKKKLGALGQHYGGAGASHHWRSSNAGRQKGLLAAPAKVHNAF